MSSISLLMYHQVGQFGEVSSHRANYCDVKRFEWQMRYLSWINANVLSIEEAVTLLREGKTIPINSVVLTFDDGCQNFVDYALPVLEKYGFPATVYIISEMTGGEGEWLKSVGHAAPELMSYDTIRNLPENITVGSHAATHIRLEQCTSEMLNREVIHSRSMIEKALNKEVKHFCYPYGAFDEQTVEQVKATYSSAVTCVRANATHQSDLHLLPRKAISYGDSLIGFMWKLHVKK